LSLTRRRGGFSRSNSVQPRMDPTRRSRNAMKVSIRSQRPRSSNRRAQSTGSSFAISVSPLWPLYYTVRCFRFAARYSVRVVGTIWGIGGRSLLSHRGHGGSAEDTETENFWSYTVPSASPPCLLWRRSSSVAAAPRCVPIKDARKKVSSSDIVLRIYTIEFRHVTGRGNVTQKGDRRSELRF